MERIKLIRSIRVCRTPALGGKLISCTACGASWYRYLSCGNSQCPICQGIKRQQWADRLSHRLLSVPYVHLTFTLPHQLNGLARRNRKVMYNLLLRSAWQTVKAVCKKSSNVGGLPGMTAVLHSWGSDMKYHVHAHCLITFGGLQLVPVVQWQWPRRSKRLARYEELCHTFRSIFLLRLRKEMAAGHLQYYESYEALTEPLQSKRWVVNHQPPTADTKMIEEYLSRYICRIGITHKRLSYDAQGKQVRIEYNDYAKQEPGQPAPKSYKNMAPLLAIDQLLQHQVPPNFHRVRHYGLHAGVTYKKWKDKLPAEIKRNNRTIRTVFQILKTLLGMQPDRCGYCGGDQLTVSIVSADASYIKTYILHQGRSPPSMHRPSTGSDQNNQCQVGAIKQQRKIA